MSLQQRAVSDTFASLASMSWILFILAQLELNQSHYKVAKIVVVFFCSVRVYRELVKLQFG